MNIHQKIIFCFLLFFIFGNYYTYASTTNQITEINNGDNSDIIIQSEKNSSFSIGLPVCCTLDPSTGRGEYQISVKGDIDVHNQLKIELIDKYTEENGDTTNNYNFFLTNKTANNNKKEDVLVTINMDKSLFDYDELSYDTSSVIHVSLESEKLFAGTWEGIIEYNIALIEKNTPPLGNLSTPGLYDANNVLLCTWEESGILLEELKEPPDDFFADCATEEEYLSRMKQYILSIQTSACHVLNEDYPETRKVLMPDSITELPYGSFLFCDNITDLYLSNGLTFYGEGSIMYCKNLTNLVMGDNIIDSDIDFNFFDNYGLPNLKRLVLPKLLPGIPGGLNCTTIKELVLPQNITEIHYAAFENWTSLEEIVLPDSIINIDSNAFRNCRNLRKINIPNSVVSIGDAAFRDCISLEEIILPNSVTSIGDSIFEGCRKLTNITIPNNLLSIPKYAFQDCRNLKKIIFPDSVTTIGYSAFRNCSSLEDVILPENITNIEALAFWNCSSINDIIIPNNVTNIPDYAFSGCVNLSSIIIPNNVTSIGEDAFSGCGSLSNIIIPNSVTTIGASAFEYCYNLKEITLSNVLTKINKYSFKNCYNLKNLIIPDSVTTIESEAFLDVPHVEYHGPAIDDGTHWGAESIN